MYPSHQLRQYQQQAIASASPERLISKLYELGISACHRDDRAKVRAVLVELMGSLDHENGGDVASRLHAIYEFCLNESALGDLASVGELLSGLREAWLEGVIARPLAA